MAEYLYHGGVPGLRVGDLLTPGHDRPEVDACPWCAARAGEKLGGPRSPIDGLALHQDRVYVTPNRLYAKHYASLYGRGWLYRVEPIGDLARSDEDTMESYTVRSARVVSIYARAVRLTNAERRRLWREWSHADAGVTP